MLRIFLWEKLLSDNICFTAAFAPHHFAETRLFEQMLIRAMPIFHNDHMFSLLNLFLSLKSSNYPVEKKCQMTVFSINEKVFLCNV